MIASIDKARGLLENRALMYMQIVPMEDESVLDLTAELESLFCKVAVHTDGKYLTAFPNHSPIAESDKIASLCSLA